MPQQNQNQWQSPYQNGQATYYGNASTSQAMPQSGNSQYQPPGAYLNQQYGNPQFANNQGKHKREKEHHESHTGETIKGTAAAIGKAVATSASIAAPVMSSYFIGRGIAKGGYYAPYPMMGPGYYGGYYPPYGYGYGNGLSNFMHF